MYQNTHKRLWGLWLVIMKKGNNIEKRESIRKYLLVTLMVFSVISVLFLSQTGNVSAGSATFGNTAIGTHLDQNDANAQSVSYFTCISTGSVTDIKAYVSGVSWGNAIAALYTVSGGSAGSLLEESNSVSIGTSFSWVNFHLPSATDVVSGTTYGLAIMGNVAINLMEVIGSGQRDHNAIILYANGFKNQFGRIWGTDTFGAMSIYAVETTSPPMPSPIPTPTASPSPSPTATLRPTSAPTVAPSPTPAPTSIPQTNIFQNGGFESGTSPWVTVV